MVIPNSQTFLLGSFFVNSPILGNWEDFIICDLVNYIDKRDRTKPFPNQRGISGHSMGGFGVIHLSMRHPDIVGITYTLNPGPFNKHGLESHPTLWERHHLLTIHT